MPTILNSAERDKVVAYLEEDAASSDALAAQCEKIGESAMAKKLRTEAMAAKIIATKMRATEFQTISGGD